MDSTSNNELLQEEAVRLLLKTARSKIEDSNPNDALAALLHAVRISAGENAIMNVLEKAKMQVEAESKGKEHEDALEVARRMSMLLVEDKDTFLYQRGDEHILKDAFEDGSSVVCSKCSMLVPRARFMQHSLYWCEHATGGESDMDDD